MNAKAVLPVACMALLLGTAGARGQYPPTGPAYPSGAMSGAMSGSQPGPTSGAMSGSGPISGPGSSSPDGGNPFGAALPGDSGPQAGESDIFDSNVPPPGQVIGPTGLPLPPGAVPSPWIEYGRPGCCGPLGLNGPITYELYARAGGNFLVGGGLLPDSLNDGWSVAGGGRTLFFDAPGQAAWVVDLGLMYSNNPRKASAPGFEYRVNIPAQPTTIANPDPVGETLRIRQARVIGLDRTTLNFSLGREWFYYNRAFDTANPSNWNLRWGIDGGGRWGTSHVDLEVRNEDGFIDYGRQHGATGSLFTAVHTDLEMPMGSWILFGGARFEYDHTWSKPLQGQNGRYHAVYLLGNIGVRF